MLAVTKPVQVALRNGCDAWQLLLDKMSFKRDGEADAKTKSLKAVQDCYAKRAVGQLVLACQSRQRFLDTLRQQHGSRFAVVELFANSRLLLHLGRASVLENVGICADRTTGLPVVPGTALKGVLSTWACWEANQRTDGMFNEGAEFVQQRQQFPTDLARRVFGDDAKEGSEISGDVVFVGGFPTTPPRLGLDIVNPHHEADGRDRANLTPNVFLCLEPDTKWHFAVYVRPGAADAVRLLKATTDWLTEALTQLGIGAKTAAGYGRFRKPSPADHAAQEMEVLKVKAAAAAVAELAKVTSEKAKQDAAAQAMLSIDYPNPATFRNRVVDKLNPGQLDRLQPEILVLQKPANDQERQKLISLLASRDYKDIRKRLRDKPWFPVEWLPQP